MHASPPPAGSTGSGHRTARMHAIGSGLAIAALLALPVAAPTALPLANTPASPPTTDPPIDPTNGFLTFGATGAPASWTVPDGIRCVWVTAWGGAGGAGGRSAGFPGGQGGWASAVSGVVLLTSGTTLAITVGTAGRAAGPVAAGIGGFGGGGSGGASTDGSGQSGGGGGGGGASAITVGGTPLVVAAGGGGGGAGRDGGTGGLGGYYGMDGGPGDPQTATGMTYVGTGGKGASLTAAGAAGVLTFGAADPEVVAPTAGSGPVGGSGGRGAFGGGGGGGGIWAGGGGYPSSPGNGAGGGGGTSLIPSGGSSEIAPFGDGRITIAWTSENPACAGPVQPIAFTSTRDDPAGDIYRTTVDGTVTGRLTSDPAADSQPAWSPDGTRIAFVSNRDGNDEIYVMDSGGGHQTRLTSDPGADEEPDWSPDGTRIAFSSDREGAALGHPGEPQVFVMRADGSTPTRITAETPRARTPSWSPDGGRLAYDASGEVKTSHIDGAFATSLGLGRNPRWSPDGTGIAFDVVDMSTNTLEEIYWMRSDGSNRTRLTTSPDKHDVKPSWGPGGTKIVFASDSSGKPQLFVSNLAGTNTRITNNAAIDTDPDWWRPNTTPIVADLGGWYTPVVPARILDSRPESRVGPYSSAWGPGDVRDVAVTDVGGVPADAEAVVVNLTGVLPTAATHLTLWPAGDAKPLASNLNLEAGQVAANLATVKVGAGGRISIANNSGSTHVVVDVVGYYAPGPVGGRHTGVTPTRILDSRATSTVGPFATPWGPGESRRLTVVGGSAAVPATAVAVVLNLTAVLPTATTHLTLWPTGSTMPTASNLNLPAGDVRANLAVVKVGTEGRISIANSSGSTDLIADLVGYYAPGPSGARFHAMAPTRVLDSRPESTVGSVDLPWGPRETRSFMVLGPLGVGLPTNATATVLNVTGVRPTATTHLTVWSGAEAVPVASNLNLPPGSVRPNLAMVQMGSYAVSVYNSSGQTDVVADLVGWFGP